MDIIAHRGNMSVSPENTLSAFQSALDVEADMMELDVQLTRDGQVVVVHDEWLGRTLPGEGKIGEMTLAEIQGLDAGRWFDPAFAGERAPSLGEVLSLLRAGQTKLNVELKTNRYPYPGLVERVVALVREADMVERVVLASFNHKTLLEVRQQAPEISCAALVEIQLAEPWEYLLRHGFQALHAERYVCSAEDVQECHHRGLAVRVWTVNEQAAAQKMFEMGVDGIITNKPAEMKQWWADWHGSR